MSEDESVSGNRLFLTRLDEQGVPTGERIEVQGGSFTADFDGPVMLHGEEYDFSDVKFKDWASATYTIVEPDPELIRLFMGLAPRPWYWRWLPRPVKHYIKRKEIRRGYGG